MTPHRPYFAQFKWLSIEPEYDPFKYNSFPKNAAQEAWEVTAALQRQVQEAHDAGRFQDFPGVLTFLSWTDATVKTSATVQRLYDRLQNAGSELVIFDVNRLHRLTPFIPAATDSPLAQLEASTDPPYRLTVISNAADYHARDDGLDAARQQAAEAQVRGWCSAQELPFPTFTADYRKKTRNTLDYPPEG